MRDEAVRLLQSGDPLGYTVGRPASPSCARRSRPTTSAAHGVDVAPDDVVVTTGSSGGFLLAFLAAFEPGDRVAMARPGYPCYRNVLTALGCEVVELALRARDPLPADGRAARAPLDDLAGLGVVVASPANPTGTMLLPDELAAIAALVRGGAACS